MLAVNEPVPLMRRAETRWIITAIIATAALFIGLWVGRRTGPAAGGPIGSIGASRPDSSTRLARSRLP